MAPRRNNASTSHRTGSVPGSGPLPADITALLRPAVSSLLDWFAREARDLPWRHTLDPYAIWISEIMLQQTQVKTVIPYWIRWMAEFPDAQRLAQAPQDRVLKLWEGLGYYTRARNLQKAAQTVVERHGGQFPRTHAEILELPGVGPYTAGAIGSIALNLPVPILDGNVIRVLARVFGLDGDPRAKETNRQLWQLAGALVESAARQPLTGRQRPAFPVSGSCSALNQSLMELGALVCTPRQPRCAACPLGNRCVARAQGRTEELPRLAPRAAATERAFAAFAIEHDGHWLLRQRPADTVNAHLWEFPNFETTGHPAEQLERLGRELLGRELAVPGATQLPLAELPVVRHAITRYRITVTSFWTRAQRRPNPRGDGFAWHTPEAIEALALTSAHRKLWRHLLAALAAPGSKARVRPLEAPSNAAPAPRKPRARRRTP